MSYGQNDNGDLVLDKDSQDFLASVLEANVRHTQAITNSIEDNLRADIVEWKAAYVELWSAVKEANQRIDSLTLQQILRSTAHVKNDAAAPAYWETSE